MRSFIHSAYKSASEYLLPPLSVSKFKEKGVLTPEEFVKAGDLLVQSCPTWTWESGDESKRWKFLPRNKQYLSTKNVPCFKRASTVESYREEFEASDETPHDLSDGEYENVPSTSHIPAKVYDIDEEETIKISSTSIPDISNIDLDDDEDENAAPDTDFPTEVDEVTHGSVIRTRKYNLIISYDKHYQVPRVWLIGYGESGNILSHEEVMEDVISDYYTYKDRKTVTIEQHPHRESAGSVVSIHPCQHAAVMKKLSSVVSGDEEFNVEQYMILFLKFISSVVPTIEYDYTMASGA